MRDAVCRARGRLRFLSGGFRARFSVFEIQLPANAAVVTATDGTAQVWESCSWGGYAVHKPRNVGGPGLARGRRGVQLAPQRV